MVVLLVLKYWLEPEFHMDWNPGTSEKYRNIGFLGVCESKPWQRPQKGALWIIWPFWGALLQAFFSTHFKTLPSNCCYRHVSPREYCAYCKNRTKLQPQFDLNKCLSICLQGSTQLVTGATSFITHLLTYRLVAYHHLKHPPCTRNISSYSFSLAPNIHSLHISIESTQKSFNFLCISICMRYTLRKYHLETLRSRKWFYYRYL